MRLAVGLLALSLLAVTSCKSVTSGVVTERNHEAAYTYVTMECGSYGSNGNCKFYMAVPHYVPESWELCLRDDSEDKPVKDQSQGCVSVDGPTWDRYRLGSHYP